MKRIREILIPQNKGVIVAYLVLLVGFILTYLLWQRFSEVTKAERYMHLVQETKNIKNLLEAKVDIYSTLLYGARGYFAASPDVTVRSWHAYVTGLNLQQNHPNIVALSYAPIVPNSQKAAFIARVRAEAYPTFTITPGGVRSEYTPDLYIEPFNERVLGFDVSSGQSRAALTMRATDTSLPAMSDRVILFRDEGKTPVQPGVIIRLALYTKNMPTATVAQRQKAVFGYVGIAVRVKDLLANAFGDQSSQFAYSVYDGNVADASHLYYKNYGEQPVAFVSYADRVSILDHQWKLVLFDTTPLTIREQFGPVAVVAIGITISVLLFFLIYFLATGRRRAIKLAEKMSAYLAKSEEKYRRVFETMQDVYYQADEKGIITMITPSIFNYTGFTAEEIIGRPAASFYVHPKTRDAFVKKVTEEGKVYDYEITLLGKTGRHVAVSVTAQLMADSHGHVIGLAGMLRDITRRKAAETALAHKNTELEKTHAELHMVVQKLQVDKKKLEEAMTKDEFLSMAAHQLRTPLGILRWNMETMLSEGKLTPGMRKNIKNNYDNVLHLIRLVNDLLDVSRINQDKIKDMPQLMHIEAILQKVLAELQEKTAEKQVTITTDISEKLPEIYYDPELVEEVLINLVANAIKYSKTNGKVAIYMGLQAKVLTISVSDNGIGIPKKDQKSIFGKFKRGSNVPKSTEGSGLGLFVVKSYVDHWHGKMHVISQENKGTTFSLELPIKKQ